MQSPNPPLISVCLATFQHEAYITQCLTSILGEGYPNLEVIVVDDGSTDRTFELIQKIQDPRLKAFTQKNSGPSMALNRAIENANGDYIATFSGDDVFLPGRLAKNLDFMNRFGHDLVFSVPEIIDENGVPYREGEVGLFHAYAFRDTPKFYHYLFNAGNFVCASTSLAKARVFKDGVVFNPSSLQLQDFEKWIDCCKRYKIALMQERLVQYRFVSESTNLSGRKNEVRTHFELMMVYDRFFENAPYSLLQEAFPESFIGSEDPLRRRIDEAFLFLKNVRNVVRSLGLKRLYELMRSPTAREVLSQEYQFELSDLYKLSNQIDFMSYQLLREVSLGPDLHA